MQPFFLVIIKTSKHLFIHPLEFHEVLLLYTPLKEKYYLGEGDKGRQIGCEVRLALALWQPKQVEPSQEDEDEWFAYQGEVTTRLMTISYRVSRWSF